MTRDTTTGTNYEKSIYNLFEDNSIPFISQKVIGVKRNGRKHIVDMIVNNILISLKNQSVSGTAEEKVPFEFMKLQHAVDDYEYDRAIIVLNGETGWTWKEYYLSQEFKSAMKILYPNVEIMSHQEFISLWQI